LESEKVPVKTADSFHLL